MSLKGARLKTIYELSSCTWYCAKGTHNLTPCATNEWVCCTKGTWRSLGWDLENANTSGCKRLYATSTCLFPVHDSSLFVCSINSSPLYLHSVIAQSPTKHTVTKLRTYFCNYCDYSTPSRARLCVQPYLFLWIHY